jgi:phosphopantetheinyl transferase
MIRVEIPAKYSRKLCVVADLRPDDSSRFFSQGELDAMRSFKTSKRREEWGLSRVAAKLLALDLQVASNPRDCQVPPAESRPGLLLCGEKSALHVSISHTTGRGAAAIDSAPIGIDLEKTRKIDDKALKFFLTPEEVEMMATLRVPYAALHLWCCKEAAWKLQTGVQTLKKVRLVKPEQHGETLLFRFTGTPSGVVESFPLEKKFIAAVASAEHWQVARAMQDSPA